MKLRRENRTSSLPSPREFPQSFRAEGDFFCLQNLRQKDLGRLNALPADTCRYLFQN